MPKSLLLRQGGGTTRCCNTIATGRHLVEGSSDNRRKSAMAATASTAVVRATAPPPAPPAPRPQNRSRARGRATPPETQASGKRPAVGSVQRQPPWRRTHGPGGSHGHWGWCSGRRQPGGLALALAIATSSCNLRAFFCMSLVLETSLFTNLGRPTHESLRFFWGKLC